MAPVPHSTIRYREIDDLYDCTAGFLLLEFLTCSHGSLPGGYISLGWWVGFSSSQISGSVIRISLPPVLDIASGLWMQRCLAKSPRQRCTQQTQIQICHLGMFCLCHCVTCWCHLETTKIGDYLAGLVILGTNSLVPNSAVTTWQGWILENCWRRKVA